jgi:hypothetical protein
MERLVKFPEQPERFAQAVHQAWKQLRGTLGDGDSPSQEVCKALVGNPELTEVGLSVDDEEETIATFRLMKRCCQGLSTGKKATAYKNAIPKHESVAVRKKASELLELMRLTSPSANLSEMTTITIDESFGCV